MAAKDKKPALQDVLIKQKKDRRLLSAVPDKDGIRKKADRRGENEVKARKTYVKNVKEGTRYITEYNVEVHAFMKDGKHKRFNCRSLDVSTSGMLLCLKNQEQAGVLKQASAIRLYFDIESGTMPEGYEMKVKNLDATVVRISNDGDGISCAMQFTQSLSQYANKTRGRYMLACSAVLLLVITAFIAMMRVESVLYFRFNKFLYLYSIITAVFLLSRYFFGAMYREKPIDMDYTPGVTILIPCFNEEEWIDRTIISCANQDYPPDKLEVIVIDDGSSDNSVEKIKQTIDKLYVEESRFLTKDRISYVVQEQNKGKRDALARGALLAKHDLVVFVDSDSFLDPYAIRNLVQPFKDPKMGGVSGRTDVANTYTNALTKMQSVRYYIAFRIMKAAEAYFDAVTCLSGPLSCYRKEIIIDNMDAWLNQRFLGQKATFGDDRAMTNFVLRHHRTGYQDSAICSTVVPNDYKMFLKQQMRWKRSWLRESIIAGSFMWRKEPFMALFFYMGLLVPVAAPIVVAYNLVLVPIINHIFPTTFLVGIFMMAALMSVVQLFLRKSSTWLFGLLFCIYYEAVLLWQMPVAWFTFWKSTWGTRMTPADVASQEKKERTKAEKNGDSGVSQ